MIGMTAVCSEPFYADRMECVDSHLEQVVAVARDSYRVRIAAPTIAASVVPGQFVMIRLTGRDAPLIGRALAVWDVIDDADGVPRAIDLVFVRKGAMTTPLAQAPIGTAVSLWGPLGNGFATTPCDELIMAVGGIGQTPMLMVAKEALGLRSYGRAADSNSAANRPVGRWAGSVTLVYGARSSDLLAGVDDFRATGTNVELCTDDGSIGPAVRVPDRLTEIIDQRLAAATPADRIRVVTCGPEIMMRKVAEACIARGIPAQVSMETPMACGIGVCFSCVAMVRPSAAEPWDYKRTCVEGPIFEASKIVW
jgi:dihydroorotate dehydrogenase electron transfer subunit